MRHNKKNKEVKISNFASVEILSEKIEGENLKISFKDNNQDNKIFYDEINIWDVILNVL